MFYSSYLKSRFSGLTFLLSRNHKKSATNVLSIFNDGNFKLVFFLSRSFTPKPAQLFNLALISHLSITV